MVHLSHQHALLILPHRQERPPPTPPFPIMQRPQANFDSSGRRGVAWRGVGRRCSPVCTYDPRVQWLHFFCVHCFNLIRSGRTVQSDQVRPTLSGRRRAGRRYGDRREGKKKVTSSVNSYHRQGDKTPEEIIVQPFLGMGTIRTHGMETRFGLACTSLYQPAPRAQ